MAIGRSAKDILIHIKGDDKDFQGALKRSDTSMGSFASSMKSYAPIVGAAFVAMGTAAVAYSVKVAMTHEQLDRGFRNLALSQGANADDYLAKIKEVSRGTVTEIGIMQNANEAMLLGIDLDTITKMMEGAAVIAQATGQSTEYLFKSMSMGMGRQSKLYLDNLGIIFDLDAAQQKYADTLGKTVSELTASEKSIAFNTAAMDGLADRMVAVGGYTETTASNIQKLKVSASDAAVAFGDELLPALTDVVDQLNRGSESSDTLATNLGKLVVSPYNFGKNIKDVNIAWTDIIDLQSRGVDTEKELINWYSLRSDKLTGMSDEYFKHSMLVLELSGYEEKAMMLERSRAYGLENILRLEKDIVIAMQEQNTETDKQLSMQERAAAKRAEIQASRGTGTSLAGLSGTSAAYASGDAYTRQSGSFTISRSAQKSGI